jgi:hypothetical protein
MTAEKATSWLDAIDTALAVAAPSLGEDEQRLAAAVLRLLSAGEPVSAPAAAAAAGIPGSRAEAALRSWPAVFWDDQGRVTGFWGLALDDMPHRIRHAGTDLGAWCAWDPLFLARIIGDLDVATTDPVTGEAITYRIAGDGTITAVSHAHTVLSFLRPDEPWDEDVIATFCHYVLHFITTATAQQWATAHPGTFVISLNAAAELARRHAARVFGAADA